MQKKGKIKSFAFILDGLIFISLWVIDFVSSEPFRYKHKESLFSILTVAVETLKKIQPLHLNALIDFSYNWLDHLNAGHWKLQKGFLQALFS